MGDTIASDVLRVRCVELQKQLDAMTRDRDAWRQLARDLQAHTARLRKDARDHAKRLDALERRLGGNLHSNVTPLHPLRRRP